MYIIYLKYSMHTSIHTRVSTGSVSYAMKTSISRYTCYRKMIINNIGGAKTNVILC